MNTTWAQWLTQAMEGIRDAGAVGWVWFIILYVILGALFLPGSILTLGAGAVYGWELGALLVSVGSTLGAALNFVSSRYLARRWIEARLESRPRFRSVAHAIAAKGWPLILLSRFSPVFPHSIVSYAAGLTRIGWFTFLASSFVGFIPLSAAYSYAGAAIGKVALLHTGAITKDPLSLAVWIASLVMTAVVTVAFGVFVARAFHAAESGDPTSPGPGPAGTARG